MGLSFGGISGITENLSVYHDVETIQTSYRTIFDAGTYTYVDIYKISIALLKSDYMQFYTSPNIKLTVLATGGQPNVIDFGNTPLRMLNTNAIQWRSGGTVQDAYLTLLYKATG